MQNSSFWVFSLLLIFIVIWRWMRGCVKISRQHGRGTTWYRCTLLLLWRRSALSHDNLCTPSCGWQGRRFLTRHYPPLSSASAAGKRMALSWTWRRTIERSEWHQILAGWFDHSRAWSPTSSGNLCAHNKVMSEIELGVWLFFRRETCQARHRQSRWLSSLAVMCRGKNRLTSERWQPRASQGEDRAIQNVSICSPVQTLMTLCASKEAQTTGCNERKTNTCPWHFFFFFYHCLIWFDLKCPCVQKAHYSKRNIKKWNI